MMVVTAPHMGREKHSLYLHKPGKCLRNTYSDLSAYVEDHIEFETNTEYAKLIEKKANLAIEYKSETKNASCQQYGYQTEPLKSSSIVLAPQESEQLSMYVRMILCKEAKRGY